MQIAKGATTQLLLSLDTSLVHVVIRIAIILMSQDDGTLQIFIQKLSKYTGMKLNHGHHDQNTHNKI